MSNSEHRNPDRVGTVASIRGSAVDVRVSNHLPLLHHRPNVVGKHSGVSIFCRIGERCREAEEIYREVQDAGVLENTVMVFGQMDEASGASFRAGHAAMTVAEYFWDDERQDVLLLIDDIFHFIQAGSEVSGLRQLPG